MEKKLEEFIRKQKPIFHGTPYTFEKFDIGFSERAAIGKGIYFTSSKEAARDYSEKEIAHKAGEKPKIVPKIIERYLSPEAKILDLTLSVEGNEKLLNCLTGDWWENYEGEKLEIAEEIVKNAIKNSKVGTGSELGKPKTLGNAINAIREDLTDEGYLDMSRWEEDFRGNVQREGYNVIKYFTDEEGIKNYEAFNVIDENILLTKSQLISIWKEVNN